MLNLKAVRHPWVFEQPIKQGDYVQLKHSVPLKMILSNGLPGHIDGIKGTQGVVRFYMNRENQLMYYVSRLPDSTRFYYNSFKDMAVDWKVIDRSEIR